MLIMRAKERSKASMFNGHYQRDKMRSNNGTFDTQYLARRVSNSPKKYSLLGFNKQTRPVIYCSDKVGALNKTNSAH